MSLPAWVGSASTGGAGQASPAWRLPLATMLPWAAAIGIAMSTQFLAQPFVWRNWPVDEVLAGGVAVAGDHLAVSLSIGAVLWLAARVPVRGNVGRAVLLAAAIGLGAVVGQLVLVAVDSHGAAPGAALLVARVLRWVVVGASVAGLYLLWRRAVDAAEAAAAAELRRVQLERQSVQARLQALRSQIEPHFLFNTLATVRRLHLWRPVTAIQASTAGGEAAATWAPVVPTPNHPEYPAAHGCTNGAIAATLEAFYGTSEVTFAIDSTVTGTSRTYTRTTDLPREVGDARVWGGMHYRHSTEVGAALGRTVAQWVARHHFRPVD